MDRLEIIVPEQYDSTRIDKFIADNSDISRSAIQSYCDSGLVTVDGKPSEKKLKVKAGQTVVISVPAPVELTATAQNIPVNIVYEDDSLLVVNKPKGMVVHPAPGNLDGTLVNALMYHCRSSLSSINGVIRPGIVHRIDRDTSGLLIVAKTDIAHISLSAQIKDHTCDRIYYAIVYGRFKDDEGVVDAPIGRHPVQRKQMCVTTKNSREAVTHYRVLKQFTEFALLELKLETGRTHQIRVHMSYIGHPVAGDEVYGPKKVIRSLGGQCLHAKTISFNHPVTGERMRFDSELPDYFIEFARKLK